MDKIIHKSTFNKICEMMDAGCQTNEPVSVSGGLIHTVYKVKAIKNDYAVKILNPSIICHEGAIAQIIFSEKVAAFAYDHGIKAMPALSLNGNILVPMEDRLALVYPWFDGEATQPNHVDIQKCAIIGSLLAQIHRLDFTSILKTNCVDPPIDVMDLNYYVIAAKELKVDWADLLSQHLDMLTHLQAQVYNACLRLSNHSMISHKDMLQKNVLWNIDNEPMVIDWESAGFINPGVEIFDVAMYWTGGNKGLPDQQAFNILMKAYLKDGWPIHNCKDVILARLKSKLDWFAYNMRRSLGMECLTEEDQKSGTRHAIKALHSILQYKEMMPVLAHWLTDIL